MGAGMRMLDRFAADTNVVGKVLVWFWGPRFFENMIVVGNSSAALIRALVSENRLCTKVENIGTTGPLT